MSAPKPPRRRYAPYGQWVKYVAEVVKLVGQNWGVSDAVRRIVRRQRFPDPDRAFKGIRAAYYEMKSREKEKGEFEI